MYRVFLVDDEIAIREGIRNTAFWNGGKYMLVGEAPDGEMALPMIQDEQPDIVITDIRMPFMDGMQMAEELERLMPRVEIIILSGYDDFNYARRAMSVGVQEYLLKPVSSVDLYNALERASARIDKERQQRKLIDSLRSRVEEKNLFLKEKILSSILSEPVQESEEEHTISEMRSLGINLVARCYIVADITWLPEKDSLGPGQDLLRGLAERSGGTIQVCSGRHGTLAVVLGDNELGTEERAYAFSRTALSELEHQGCRKAFASVGNCVFRLGSIPDSASAARHARHVAQANGTVPSGFSVIGAAEPVAKVCAFLEENYSNPNLMLRDAAEQVNMSDSRFSSVFAQKMGITFTEYLTDLRMNEAKKLLSATRMRSSQVAAAVGCSDPHYFSYLFKKNCGMTPSEYRRSVSEENDE